MVLDKFVHPAEVDRITCAEADQLVRSVNRIRRSVSFVTQDLERAIRERKTIVFLLDFSELHAYLWPETSKSQYKMMIRYLLTQSVLNFALPPGSVVELIYKLRAEIAQHKLARTAATYLASSAFVSRIVQASVATATEAEKLLSSLPGTQVEEFLDSVRGLGGVDERLGKLAALFDSERMQPLSRYVEAKSLVPDQETYHEALAQLRSYRPDREDIVNSVDALNYSITFALNNLCYEKKNTFFLYVTSSPIPYSIFEAMKWKDDPLFERGSIIRTSLVRQPTQLLYYSYLKSSGRCGERELLAAEKDLEYVGKLFAKNKKYMAFRQGKASAIEEVEFPRSPATAKRFEHFVEFYRDVIRPLGGILAADASQEQNKRQLRRVDISSVGGLYLLSGQQTEQTDVLALAQAAVDYRGLISLYDRLINLTEALVSRARTSIAGVHREAVSAIDRTKSLFAPTQLEYTSKTNNQLASEEVIIYMPSGSQQERCIFLCADIYATYVSFWWNTNTGFSEFMKAVRYFNRVAAESIKRKSIQITPAEHEKQYNGIYFFIENGVKHFPLDAVDGLATESLLRLCEPQWHVRYVRIGLPYGDLCYDFEPLEPFPQRAGILTHLELSDALGALIQWTHTEYVHADAIRDVVSRSLKRLHVSNAGAGQSI